MTNAASFFAIGAVLPQGHIAHTFRVLCPAETGYSTKERQIQEIVWTVKHILENLFGRTLRLVTDHRRLTNYFLLKTSVADLNDGD